MFLQPASVRPGTTLHADYCVVGSGMGGAAVAQALAAAGRDVLILEAGGLEPGDGPDSPATEHTGRAFGYPSGRDAVLGGSSHHWHGVTAPLDPWDFAPRPWIPYSGWPIAEADLAPYYARAAALLGVPGLDAGGGDAAEADGSGAGARRSLLAAIGYDTTLVAPKLFAASHPVMRWQPVLRAAAQNGTLRCGIHLPVLELRLDDSGCRVAQAVVGLPEGVATVTARTFIVCAGALGTPRLLLNSRQRTADGVGNASGLVGRFLLDHPTGLFSKLRFAVPRKAPLYAGMRAGDGATVTAGLRLTAGRQEQLALPNHHVLLRPSVSAARIDEALRLSFLSVRGPRDLTLRQIAGILTHRDLMARVLLTRFGLAPRFHYADLVFFTEQLPNPDSRVELSPTGRDRHGYPLARVHWQLTDRDFSAFERYAAALVDEGLCLDGQRAARRDGIDDWRRTVTSAAHHLGTARMGDSPRTGVVSRDLQLFGISNLYICDGSTFPTAGSTNPSLTITALALRLVDHLGATEHAAS